MTYSSCCDPNTSNTAKCAIQPACVITLLHYNHHRKMLPSKQTRILIYIPITHLWTSSWACCESVLRMMVVCKLLLLMVSFEEGNEVILSCHCGKWLQIEDLFLICFHQDLCSRLQICSCNVCCARTSLYVITWKQKNLGYLSAKMWWSMGCPENLSCFYHVFFGWNSGSSLLIHTNQNN